MRNFHLASRLDRLQLRSTGGGHEDLGTGHRRWGGGGAVATVLCLLALGGAADAGAATWKGRTIAANDAYRLPLFSVSCPSSQLCVAVGGGNTIASSTNPGAGPEAWKVVYAGSGPNEPNQAQIRGIDCPSPQLCVAVTFDGLVYTSTDPTGSAAAWQVEDLATEGPNLHLYGVSCPTVSFCAASAGGAKIATSTDPLGGAWSTTELAGPMELRGISCASAALCVAVGDDGAGIRPDVTNQARIVSSSNPLGGAWGTAPLPGRQNLFGVSCPSAALCVSGDTRGDLLVAKDPTGGTGAWRPVDGGGSVQITDVDCVSTSLCLAIDNNGDILTSTRPTGGPGDWTFTNVAPFPGVDGTAANALFGASCPSRDFCAVSANGAQIFTSGDPFEAEQKAPGTAPGKQRGKRRPKRPRTTIAAMPPPGVEIPHGRKITIRYRFFARNHVQVRGFVCKLDGRPLKRCRSPKAYRIGVGRHVFRVRAVGWTGLRGPVEVHRFRACRPTPYGNCMRRLPAS